MALETKMAHLEEVVCQHGYSSWARLARPNKKLSLRNNLHLYICLAFTTPLEAQLERLLWIMPVPRLLEGGRIHNNVFFHISHCNEINIHRKVLLLCGSNFQGAAGVAAARFLASFNMDVSIVCVATQGSEARYQGSNWNDLKYEKVKVVFDLMGKFLISIVNIILLKSV